MNHASPVRRGHVAHPTVDFGTREDAVALHYVLDFEASESVLYTGPGVFPGRVFLLRVWRHGKDGIMHLLGYDKEGHWRDPTICYPSSYVRYMKRPPHPAGLPHLPPPHEHHDRDSTDTADDNSPLASRPVMVELEPGVFELPTSLTGVLPHSHPHPVIIGQHFTRPVKKHPVAARPPLPLGTPLERKVEFGITSAQFRNRAQVDNALAGLVKVLQQFPALQVVLEGNVDGPSNLKPALYGRGAAARAYQNAPERLASIASGETFNSVGELMDARARAVKRYLVDKGIQANRITCRPGRIYPEQKQRRSVTVILSNP